MKTKEPMKNVVSSRNFHISSEKCELARQTYQGTIRQGAMSTLQPKCENCSRKHVFQRFPNIKKIIFVLTATLFLGAFFLPTFSIAKTHATIEAYGINTIAGGSALIKTKPTIPNERIEFWIQKPDGGELFIEAETNDEGIAKTDLYDYHTRRAGIYQVAVKLIESNDFGSISTFRVYPEEVSETKSLMFVDKQTAVANGFDTVTLSIILKDTYGNPIPDHSIDIIGSRTDDTIERLSRSPFTDENGKIRYAVSSTEEGVSIYSSYDTSAGKSLEARIKIAYYNSEHARATQIGGDPNIVLAQALDDHPDPAYLKIENIPDIAPPNETVSFTVNAYDENDNSATTYTGTVRFSSSDANASLPQDYTFSINDLGSHTFSLGLKFLTEGTQTIEVVDMNNINLKASKSVRITDEILAPGDDMTIILLAPQEGSYNQSNIDVEGEAPIGWNIDIYDNNELIGQTFVGSDGKFFFTAKNLGNGIHTIYTTIVDTNNDILETSKSVTINIDMEAPQVDEINIGTSGETIAPRAPFEVSILSEKNLESVSVVLGTELIEFTQDINQAGRYVGTITAPNEPGEYPLDIILVDELGNTSSYEAYSYVQISDFGVYPTQVTGIQGTADDKRITLNWEASDDDGYVEYYRIYYGTNADDLNQSVDTFDSSTTWYIPNLIAGTTYYFAITAIDNDGYESEEQSEIIEAIPLGIIYPDKVSGITIQEEKEKVVLNWNPSNDDTYIAHYRIYYGTDPENLDNTINTYNGETSWYIDDLVGGVTYHFALTAIDSDGHESLERSEIQSAIPLSPPSPSTTPESGPESHLLIILTLLGTEAYVLKRYFLVRKKFAQEKTRNNGIYTIDRIARRLT